jgi:transposase
LEALGQAKGRPPVDPVERDNARLQARVAKLQAELATSRRVIEVQGKLSALLEQLATGGATDEGPAK